jgi:hypothetical protein
MTMLDSQDRLFRITRTALALSLTLLPGCIVHLATGSPLTDAISTTTIWLIPGLVFLYHHCRTIGALHRLLVFLLPFGRLHSPGIVIFCWLWPVSIPVFLSFNKRLDRSSNDHSE